MEKKKKGFSLEKKVGIVVLIFCIIYFAAVLVFSGIVENRLNLYSIVSRNHNLARSLAVSVDQDLVTGLFEDTKALYESLKDKYGDDINSKEYLSEFDYLKTDEYIKLSNTLKDVVDETNKVFINFHLEFRDTGKTCMIVDTDPWEDGRYSLGWQSRVRDFKSLLGYPYEILEDDKDGYVIITQAPFYHPYYGHNEILGYITIAEKRANLGIISLAFILIFGLSFFIITVLFIIISVAGIKIVVVNPIIKLSGAAVAFSRKQDKLTESHFFRNLNINSNDEIRVLADSMMEMEHDLYTYINDLAEMTRAQEHMAAELEVASKIQAKMLPEELVGYNGEKDFDVCATMKPAKAVGGDFYDFFAIDDDHIGITIADVSDKGVPAALFMVVSRTLIKNTSQATLSPAEVLSRVNKLLCAENNETMFVTVLFGIYNVSKRKLTYVNAGHEYPAVYRKSSGKYELIVDEHDLVLGIMDDVDFSEKTLEFEKGDKLFLYTDGVPDAADENGDAFGLERMVESLNRNSALSGKDVLFAMQNDLESFENGAHQFDDITMLLLESY